MMNAPCLRLCAPPAPQQQVVPNCRSASPEDCQQRDGVDIFELKGLIDISVGRRSEKHVRKKVAMQHFTVASRNGQNVDCNFRQCVFAVEEEEEEEEEEKTINEE
jgi:hypothetical protein